MPPFPYPAASALVGEPQPMQTPQLPILVYDTETTGASANAALIELAARWLGGDHHGEAFSERCRPHDGAELSPFAFKANGYTREEICTWQSPAVCADQFVTWLNATAPEGQLILSAAYNAAFDDRFLRGWFSRHITGGHALVGNMFASPHCIMQSPSYSVKSTWPDYKARFGSAKLVDVYRGLFKRNYDNAHNALPDVDAATHVLLACDFTTNSAWTQYHHLLPS